MEVAVDTVQPNVTSKKAGTEKPRAISIRRAEEESGLSRSTINRLIWSGKLRTSKVGSRRIIHYDSYEKVLGLTQSEAA
jgi:predicted DNA-binding transcriptional regulator AlpA